MLGSSRETLAALQHQLAGRSADSGFASAAADLLNVSTLLAGDKSLRIAISDSGQPAEARQALVRDLFSSKVGAIALDTLVAAAGSRWSHDGDIVEATEALGALVVFAAADAAGALDRVEEEIFRFARAVSANSELQMTLTDPALPAAAKSAVVRDVLAGRAAEGSEALLAHIAGNLRGRRVDAALESLSVIAAAQRSRIVAEVRVAISLSSDQSQRLAAVLGRLTGRQVSLNVVVDPSLVGGVSVRLGGEVIDGSVRTRLEQARRVLVS